MSGISPRAFVPEMRVSRTSYPVSYTDMNLIVCSRKILVIIMTTFKIKYAYGYRLNTTILQKPY